MDRQITVEEGGAVHGLGRVKSPPDPRDSLFLAASRFDVAEPRRHRRQHYTGNTRSWDQGRIGSCTAWSFAHIVAAGPVTQRPYTWQGGAPPLDPIRQYCRSQEFDKARWGWSDPTFCQDRQRPGGAGDWGATMRGAASAGREGGWIGNYWWLQDLDQIIAFVANVAPVWMGTPWRRDMSTPDKDGYIWPTGALDGGHAWVIDQVEMRLRYFWMLNSWGRWGQLGRAKITFEAVEALMRAGSEALAVSEIRRTT